QELGDAKLVADEEIALEAQHNKARHAEKISTALHRAYALIQGGERALGALDALRQVGTLLGGIAALEEDYASLQERVSELCYALEDVHADVERMREEADVDPGQIDRVEARLDLLSKLRRKYGA
ncbi:MAG TPA: hypothetical protein PKE04_10865, partial [Clostridia bacterium]|nr:hypothetical protein [Clostridia bacterium]